MSDKKEDEAKKCGGSEKKETYEKPDQVKGCDKGDHKERSIANQPNHQDHWKKSS